MEKVKLGKHKHTLTDLLKVLIFSIVMLGPLFAVGSKCIYVACNKNAKDSYYGETINEEKQTYTDKIKLGYTYYLQRENLNRIVPQTTFIKIDETAIFNSNRSEIPQYWNNNKSVIKYFRFTYDSSTNTERIVFFNENYIQYNSFGYVNFTLSITFTAQNSINLSFDDWFYYIEYNNYSYLDNAFYYAVDELNEQPIFSWTKNTAMYTAINTMTEGLELGENNILALLLTYWTLMTLIYIIFDIVIVLFTKLTHMNN